jgi:zinc protease
MTALKRALGAVFAVALFAPAAHAIDIQPVTSPLGIQAWLVEDHSVQLVSMSYSFAGGSSQEPAAKRGIGNMLVSLLDEGAGDLDTVAYSTELEDLSISLDFNSDRDSVSGSMRTITDNRNEAVRLLTLALTSPRFDSEPVERIRARILQGIRNRDRSPSQAAAATFNQALYPGHIYGTPESGTLDSVNSITTDDLRAFQKRVMARDNLKVAVVGDIDPKALGTMLDAIFGALPARADLVPVADAPPPQAKFIDVPLPGAAQTQFRFAGVAPKRTDPDYIAAYVAAFILGGGTPGTRLYDSVRVERGLAYSIGLGLDVAEHAGWFLGNTSTRADQADQVLQIVKDEIKRYAADGPTAAELASAKAYLIGSYPLRFVTTSQVAGQLMGVLIGNLGIDYINKRNDLIAAVTLDDVKQMAKKLFAGDMLISRVGPPSS